MTEPQDDNLLEQALEWCVLLHDVDAGPAEQAHFAAWLATSEAHRQAWQRAEDVWQRLNPLAERLAEPVVIQPRQMWAWRSLAALLLLGLVLGGTYDPAWLATYRTAVAEQQEWRLDDGSVIRLAPDSALDVDYSPAQRHIRLYRGEAWFQVAADPARPFIVDAAAGHTQALGTAFDIRQRGEQVRVLVSEHRVEVSLGQQQQQVAQNQALTYGPDGLSSVTSANVANELAWQQQRLVFQDMPLAQVLAELQHYTPSRLQLTDAALENLSVTAVFDTRHPEDALNTLAEVLALRLTNIGPWLTLVRPGEKRK